MSKGSSGTNTVQTQSAPPAAFMQAYQNSVNQATQVAGQPLQTFQGNTVAPINAEQLQGINGGINNAAQYAQPDINSAAGYIGASTAPLLPGIAGYLQEAQGAYESAGNENFGAAIAPTQQAAGNAYGAAAAQDFGGYINPAISNVDNTNFGSYVNPAIGAASGVFGQAGNGITTNNPVNAAQIAQYESPYTQSVVNATQAQFNNQNAQQQQQVAGNAISNGAFGGDRSAVAAGITAGQQQLAQAPVIAGLENQGYSQALGEANTQQQTLLQQQTAQQQAQLAGAQGELSAGQLGLTSQQAGVQSQLAAGQLGLTAQQAAANNQLAVGQGETALGNQNLAATQAAEQAQIQAGQGISALGQTALGANEANAWLNSQAGYGMANLGNETYQQQLGQGEAELGAGSTIQSNTQANLNVPYQNFLAQQAYPFQTTQYLANIAEGLGGASGGQSSTTSPGPSTASQIAGTGIAGAGILGLTGAFGSTGWLTGLLNRGGGIGRAPGGSIPGIDPSNPNSININVVPNVSAAPGHMGIPHAPQAGNGNQTNPLQMLGTVNSLRTLSNDINGMHNNGNAGGPDLPVPPIPPEGAEGGGLGMMSPPDPNIGISQGAELGGGAGFASGGIVQFPSHLTRMPGTGNHGITANSNMPHMGAGLPKMKLAAGGGADFDPDDDVPPPVLPSNIDPTGLPPVGDNAGITGGGPPPPPPAAADAGGMGGITAASQSANGIAAQPTDTGSATSPWQALLATGLGIMGGTSPHAAVNIGRGGMEGLQFNEQQRARAEQQNLARMSQQEIAKYHSGELDLRGQQLAQTGDLTKAQMAQTMTLKQAEMAQQMALHKMQIGMEGARLAEEKAFHQESLTPPEVRIFNAYSKMSPEDQQHFAQLNMAQKGIPDITGGAAAGTSSAAVPPSAMPSSPKAPEDALPSDVQAPPPAARNDQFLSSLNPQYQPMVKALAEGRMAMPAKPTPLQQQLIAAAGQYDPTFDATDFNKRSGTAKDFASGQSAKAITSINTATAHLSSLSDQMDALHNGDIPLVNSISNWIKTNTGQSAPTTATETRDAVANELRKVFATTGGGGLEELKDWQSHFPINGSPTQQKDAIRQAVDLMQPRMESLAHQWNVGMGTNHQGLDLLSPSARDSWQKLTGAASPVSSAPAPTYNRPAGSGATQRPMQAPVDATPVRVGSPAEAAKLPSGTHFLDPNGIMRMVP